jgi:hypothetical protein
MSKAFRRLSIVLALAFLVALAGVPVRAEEPAAPETATTSDYHAPALRVDCKAPFQLPSSARRAIGDVVLNFQAIILRDGTVGYVELLNDDRPYPGVEQAARESLRNWRYEPGTLAGEPVDAGVIVSVQFRGSAAASVTRAAEKWIPRNPGNKMIPGVDSALFTGDLDGYVPMSLENSNPTTVTRPTCQFVAGPRCGYLVGGGPTVLVDAPVGVSSGNR